MTEDVRHDAVTDIVLLLKEVLVITEVVESLLPDDRGPGVEAIAADLTDLRMSLADVVTPCS